MARSNIVTNLKRGKMIHRICTIFALFFYFHAPLYANDLECLFTQEHINRSSLSIEQRLKFRDHYQTLRVVEQTKMRLKNAKALTKLPVDAQELELLTFNTGLLWNPIISLARVPDADIRVTHVINALRNFAFRRKNPIIFVQELWRPGDQKKMAIMAEEENLHWVIQDKNSGLGFFVPRSLGEIEVLDFVQAQRSWGEWFVGIKKGIQPVIVHMPNGKKLLLINAHFAYSQDSTTLRLAQVRQLKELTQTVPHDYLVMGADLNSSDRFVHPEQEARSNFVFDRQVYHEMSMTGLMDSYAVMHESSPGFTQDPYRNPLAAAGPTTATEPAQRLDYIMVSSRNTASMAIISSEIIFDRPVLGANGEPLLSPTYDGRLLDLSQFTAETPPAPAPGGELFLSDHFGLTSRVALF
jgi:hypothetical protein